VNAEPSPGAWRVFGWSAYLACSWTWCIGMFLPVLLVRDYGMWGFVVFAVPNVIGAAAVGWIIKSPEHSRRLTETHAGAMRWFSYVTIAFHAFWLTALGPVLLVRLGLLGPNTPSALVVAVVGAVVIVASLLPATRISAWRVALSVFAVSACAILVCNWRNPHPSEISDLESTLHTSFGVIPVALSCALGFLLCPHLDATLHFAARESGELRRLNFGVGFGAIFVLLILFTLEYAGLFVTGLPTTRGYAGELIRPYQWVLGAVTVHMLVQAWFTTSRHVQIHAGRGRHAAIAAVLIGFATSVAALFLRNTSEPADWSTPELIYRLFLSFYGLVFPAYVWICMIPTRDRHAGTAGPRGRLKLRVTAVAIVLAAPMFWMGFIARHEIWLIPGLAVVLLARLLVLTPRTSSAPSPPRGEGGSRLPERDG